ncbi:ARL14 effector protein isoform X1 [Trichoplusia ni]|uniref:ARL14 effector protein isoform X1 n=1 Tax=Trichoplusia ni TaxID=7111 RepID=A0A7E5WDQ5_TRINI|nr:ARL14 effector protein isoform X1 [Trichoplusia ni]
MNEQSAFIINEESHEKIVKEDEEEKRKELKRKKTNARQRAYYQRQKDLKINAGIIKKTVPKSNAERQRKFRQHNAEKSYMYSKLCVRKSKNIYNERGLITVTGKDLCDCLDETCPGCHFPCSKCNSNKCGLECRVNRKWMYDKIEIEGNDFVVKNDYKHK